MQVGIQVPLEPKGTAVEHVVFFPSSDGTPAFRRLPSFEEAVRLVEHLRNVEGVEHVTVHSLTEVPLAFRAYYRVEVPAGHEAPAVVAEVPVHAPVVEVPVVEVPAVEVPVAEVPAVEPVAHTVVPLAPQQVEDAPALALVQDLPVQELPVQEQPVQEQLQELPVQGEQPQPATASSNGQGRDGVPSLGFFA